MHSGFKLIATFVIVLFLFSIFITPVFAQEKKKEDSKISNQINGLRTTSVTTQAISTSGCSTAASLGSLSCGTSKSGSGSLASGATNWHKVYASSTGTLTVNLSGPSSADFDLYIYSSCSGSWICRPYTGSSNESCTINATAGNYYYIGINSYSGSGSYSINTSLSCSGGTTCNSSSYTSCTSAASMSSGSSKTNMCGTQQFYKISTSTPCTVTWTMTPQSTADFDLYVKNSSGSCPSTSSYNCRPYYGTGSQETCSASLSAGTYYALVNKYGGTGSYNIQVNTSNCGSTCTNECSSGQKRCNGSYSQSCGNYDSDSCYEWPSSTSGSGNTYCSYGCNSGTGQCNSSCHTTSKGSETYCSTSCGCNSGEGDCDSDSECNTGLDCVNDIGSFYGWSSSTDVCLQSIPVSGTIVGGTAYKAWELSSRYKLQTHADAHPLGSTAATKCNDPILATQDVPHYNVELYDKLYVINGTRSAYNLHIGRLNRNNQECTVVYITYNYQTNSFCREYCGSERKNPGDVIRGPPVAYPYSIPTNIMDELLRHHSLYYNPAWPVDFPVLLITILGIILYIVARGICVFATKTTC